MEKLIAFQYTPRGNDPCKLLGYCYSSDAEQIYKARKALVKEVEGTKTYEYTVRNQVNVASVEKGRVLMITLVASHTNV